MNTKCRLEGEVFWHSIVTFEEHVYKSQRQGQAGQEKHRVAIPSRGLRGKVKETLMWKMPDLTISEDTNLKAVYHHSRALVLLACAILYHTLTGRHDATVCYIVSHFDRTPRCYHVLHCTTLWQDATCPEKLVSSIKGTRKTNWTGSDRLPELSESAQETEAGGLSSTMNGLKANPRGKERRGKIFNHLEKQINLNPYQFCHLSLF